VFWPYLLGDVLSSVFWPYAYYDPFWYYGSYLDYDYGSYAPSYWQFGLWDIYGTGGDGYGHYYGGRRLTASRATAQAEQQITADVRQSCGALAPGVTSFPIDRIRQTIRPAGDQVAALDDLAAATSRAIPIVDASCPSEAPLTPLGRLDAVEQRLEAMIKAIQIVQSPLAAFYDSLSDEQKQRFDAIGEQTSRGRREPDDRGRSAADALGPLCGRQADNFTKLPLQRIEQIVEPTGEQQSALEKLKEASAKAAGELRASCPAQTGDTTVARLDAIGTRLHSMVQAIKTLRPTLGSFYASLSDEQKARFNGMGQQAAQIR